MQRRTATRRSPRDERLNDCAWLSARYVADGLTMERIAALVQGSRDAVRNGLLRCDIPRRKPGATRPPRYPLLYDEAWLRARYLDDRWSYRRIAKHLGCPYGSVQAAIGRWGIPSRINGTSTLNRGDGG